MRRISGHADTYSLPHSGSAAGGPASPMDTAASARSRSSSPMDTASAWSRSSSPMQLDHASPIGCPLPAGMHINEKGMLEKSTFGDAYRAAKVKHRDSILSEGFSPSKHFGGIDPMIGGPALIVSETRGGASAFGDGDFGPGHYDMYKINAHGLTGASLKDNVDYNTATVARQLGRTPEALRAMHPRDVAEGALEFREAHVDASAGRVDRIRLIEQGVLPRKDYGDSSWDRLW